MRTEFISPVGRLVQGSISLEIKKDMDTDQPVLGDDGQPIRECYVAIAIPKNDPGLPAFYALFTQTARAEFPHLFDAAGNCTHPRFAWKVQDGDGRDASGKSVADKPGFAGHFIFKMGTRYLPKCFHHGKYDPAQQIQNPTEVIKRGYYVRVVGKISGNGVKPNDRANPGLYVSPELIELVGYGEEIVSGPNAAGVFGRAPAVALPPGASATPVVSTPGLAPNAPALPGLPVSAPALPGVPALPGAPVMPTLPGAPALPLPPQFVMQPSAMGATREALHAQGWTDDLLIQHGYMVKVG